jgi:hypothetical protein
MNFAVLRKPQSSHRGFRNAHAVLVGLGRVA